MALANIIADRLVTCGKHGLAIKLPSSVHSRQESSEARQQVDSVMDTVETAHCFANGTNAIYIESLFNKWAQNPFGVHKSWYTHFDNAMGKEDRSAGVINAAHVIDFFKRWSNEPSSVDASWYWYFVRQTPPAPKSSRLPNRVMAASEVEERENIDEYMASVAEAHKRESRPPLSLLNSVKPSYVKINAVEKAPKADKRDTSSDVWSDSVSAATTQTMPLGDAFYDYFTSIVTRQVKQMDQRCSSGPTAREDHVSVLTSVIPPATHKGADEKLTHNQAAGYLRECTLSSKIASKEDNCAKIVAFQQKNMANGKNSCKDRSTMNMKKFEDQSVEDLRFHYFYNTN